MVPFSERKGKQKTDPLYYFLKILANAGCYGIYAEVNKLQKAGFATAAVEDESTE